jgi:SAM-dependent methyltransferase
MANLLKKILLKNIQISYALLDRYNSSARCEQDSLYRFELKQFLESFRKHITGKNVLDIGSGSWTWTKDTYSLISHVVTFDQTANNVIDIVGDIYTLSEHSDKKNYFDVCIVTDVFEHLFDPAAALEQINKILRSNGLLIISTPFDKNLHGEEYGDYWRITRQGWRYLLEKSGFQNISISWFGKEQMPFAYFVSARKSA